MICANPGCGIEFTPKRATAKFHSPKCRVEAARKAGVNPGTGEVLNPNKKIESTKEQKYDREKNLKAFIKMGVVKTDWISTGIPEFDALTRIPRGRITQIQGPYAVGKTTLCLNMIKGLKDKKVLYIDSEAALNPDLLVDLELDASNFTLYNESSYMEDIAEIIRDAAVSGKYELIVLDSVPMTSTKTIADSEITASNIGQKAKILHKLMGWIAMDLKRTNTAMVFINQEREMIGTYVPTKYTPGGTAIPFQASLIIGLKSIKSWRFPKDPKDGIYKGQEIEATILKSKVGQPHLKGKFKIFYPQPIPMSEEEQALADKESF
jgi:recombination protein RecA